ncbi:MAG: 4-hydroxythreonine-4-phosphate dehydrogenase PdxA [Gammaproteobacteria bacterium]|nr:4-hydroxythreonine-4-phosphate dehydrogenase PdxA [Gammaproteobacteria bacterium]
MRSKSGKDVLETRPIFSIRKLELIPSIVISTGEPAGIGPDLLAKISPRQYKARLILVADPTLIQDRFNNLNCNISVVKFDPDNTFNDQSGFEIIPIPLAEPSIPGTLNVENASYVLEVLKLCCQGCLDNRFSAMVTGPVQKNIINQAGIPFSGHTEFLAEICNIEKPVMLLASDDLRVALVTTHLPLKRVPKHITGKNITDTVHIINKDMRARFGLKSPHIKVCGLNPHAGENGYLGREEIDIIIPTLEKLKLSGINVSGPYPADTLFTPDNLKDADVVLAMYHDQGLPVLKNVGFHNAINTTLGLPIIRTSVDHGTALSLAGTGKADSGSLHAAINSAIDQAYNRANFA